MSGQREKGKPCMFRGKGKEHCNSERLSTKALTTESLPVASSIESDLIFFFEKLLVGKQTPLRIPISSVPFQASPGPEASASLFSQSLEVVLSFPPRDSRK